jgi:hypothetical protein
LFRLYAILKGMSDIVPQGIDQTNGQIRGVNSLDTFTNTEGITVNQYFLPLDATVTDLQNALNNNNIVYLLPGTYSNTMNSVITIPTGKALIGSHGKQNVITGSGLSHVLTLGTSGYISMTSTASIQGVELRVTGRSLGVGVINMGSTGCSVIGCGVSVTSGTMSDNCVRVSSGQGFTIRDCTFKGTGAGTGAGVSTSTSGNDQTNVVENCTAQQLNIGFDIFGHVRVSNCTSVSTISHGFNLSFGNTNMIIEGCMANGTSGGAHGFNVASAASLGYAAKIHNCHCKSSNGNGFQLTVGGAGSHQFVGCTADTSAITGTDFNNTAGWSAAMNFSI